MHRNIKAGDGVALPAYSLRLDTSGAYLARSVWSFNPAFELRLRAALSASFPTAASDAMVSQRRLGLGVWDRRVSNKSVLLGVSRRP